MEDELDFFRIPFASEMLEYTNYCTKREKKIIEKEIVEKMFSASSRGERRIFVNYSWSPILQEVYDDFKSHGYSVRSAPPDEDGFYIDWGKKNEKRT